MRPDGTMTIGELARRAAVSSKAIRFYEELGLLAPQRRSSSGYRLYDERGLRRLEAIRIAKEAGLTLEEIRQFVPVIAGEEMRCAEVLPLLERKTHDVEDQIERLSALLDYLKCSTEICRRAQRRGRTVVCPLFSSEPRRTEPAGSGEKP